MSSTPTLLTETGKFYLDNENSQYVTLGYSGDSDFLTRMENFFHNYGVLKSGTTHKLKDNFFYILCPMARLDAAVFECIKGEIIKNEKSEIDYWVDYSPDVESMGMLFPVGVSWDEQKLIALANERANLFFEQIERVNLNIYSEEGAGIEEEYSVGRN